MLKTIEENAAKEKKHEFRANDNYESHDKFDSARDNENNTKQEESPSNEETEEWGMAKFQRRKRYCKFTAEGILDIDYKDIGLLKGSLTENGKIVPR